MKTIYFFIILFSPLLVFGQTSIQNLNYSIVVQGEKWIAQNKPDSTLALAQELLSQAKIDPFEKRQAFYLLGKASSALGRPEDAIDPLQKSIVLSQKSHDDPLLLWSLVATSGVMGDKENPSLDSVMFYLEGAKVLAENLHDTSSLARVYINTSSVFYLLENYEQALSNNYSCESLLKNSNFEYEKGLNYLGKGNSLMEIYIREEKGETLQNAQRSYENAIEIFNRLGNKIYEAHSRNSLAGSLLYSENLDKASQEIKQSIKLGIELNDQEILLNGYYTLSTLYEMEDNKAGAVDALEKLNGILQKSGSSEDVAFLKEQFSNSDAKVSSALINSKINIYKKQIENQSLVYALALLSCVFLLALGLVAYYRQRNRLLKEELNTALKTQEIEYMRARFEGEEIGRHRIARQIHDGVGGLLVSAKWNLESALEEISEKEVKVAARLNENLRLQENSYKELRRVVYELEREDTPWWEDLQKLYQQMAERNTTKIRFYTYNLDRKVGGAIGEEARLIVQEIITNALKHAKATEINVQINQIEDVLGIIIEDNGIGFDQNRIVKGIGLKSIEERCSKLGGEMSLETGKGAGTTVFVDIPLSKQNILKENPLLYAGAN